MLDEYNPAGFEQTDESLNAYFEEPSFRKEEILKMLEGYQYTLSEIDEKNWNAEWEENFQPVVVDDFFAVRAHFHQPITTVEHEIIITPKMSFGTGHHATTYMMVQQMKDLDFTNKTVFDFGTGTGILAVLAEKLGATSITAIDVDDWSIENARENAEQNQCHKISLSLTSNLPDDSFDILLANINRNVILAYMNLLVKRIKNGGLVLLSGLLATDEDDIVQAAVSAGLRLVKMKEKAGWLSLLFVNS